MSRAKLGPMPRNAFLVDHPELRGVFVGGCVARGVGSRFRAKAHAHDHGEHRGWICFRSTHWLHLRAIWLHELAHVVTREGHTARWRAYLLQIGGTLDPILDEKGRVVTKSYHPRTRKDAASRVAEHALDEAERAATSGAIATLQRVLARTRYATIAERQLDPLIDALTDAGLLPTSSEVRG